MGSGGNFIAKLTNTLETLGRTKMPLGACWLLDGSLQRCTRTVCGGEVAQSLHLRQVPAPSSATTWSPWENELSGLETVIMTLLPACLDQHRAQLSSE